MLQPFDTYALLFCRVCLGLVFLLAGAAKLRDPRAFAQAVGEMTGLPTPVAVVVAPVVITAELAVALLMVLSTTTGWGALLALSLLAVFSVPMAVNLARRRRISCNCFGRSARPISGTDLVRNIGLIACAGLALALTPGGVGAVISLADGLLTAAMAATLVTAWLRLGDISMLLKPPKGMS